jgi:hypothetical protein
MLIPLGILAASGASAGSFDLLETQVLGSNTASVTFSSLSSYAATYEHLQIRMTVRSTRSADGDILAIQYNGDTTAGNYAYHFLAGSGSSVNSGGEATNFYAMTYIMAGSNPTNAFTPAVVDILDPYNTNKNTVARTLFGGAFDRQIVLQSFLWKNTAALTSIAIKPVIGSTLLTGSRFSLYGIKAA